MMSCRRHGIEPMARMKEGMFVAAWKSGGYCLMRMSFISQDPYFDEEPELPEHADNGLE